jgi:hypothetical protein
MRTFKTRAELYDYMIERGDAILEGDDKAMFLKHADKRSKEGNSKASAAVARVQEAL